MRGYVIVCAAAALLAACGSNKSGSFKTSDGDKGTITIDQNTGAAKLTIKDDKGHSMVINSGADASAELPNATPSIPAPRSSRTAA